MKRSTDRILTTHTGSLPRPPDLIEMLRKADAGEPVDQAAFQRRVREAVAEAVRLQRQAGIDIINDGEEGKPGYSTYIKDRCTGFEGENRSSMVQGEGKDFPEWAEWRRRNALPTFTRPACNGPIAWKDFDAVKRDIENLRQAAQDSGAEEVFMTSASPGVIAVFLTNDYYPSHEAYLEALTNVMRDEYRAIVDAGFILQLDCPDLAMTRHNRFVDRSLEDFRSIVQMHVEAINEATKDLPPDRMRLHLCWGNYEGPHHLDVPLKDILDIVLKARPQGLSFEGANPRHEHEWRVWREIKLPADKVLIPGVIDSTTNFVEHPEVVADRIERYAEVVGKENVIASTDCGFGTFATSSTVDARISWAKLASLAEGARIATEELK
ncbi:MAG TPA: cobalamin-independent methionine synthase II family protein [Dehalococcoidia bacterium]|nr:cobalamin-independent methionine synthase II family protein [Dehalococcoidia bacterium]